MYVYHLQPWTSRFHCTKLHHCYDPNNEAAIMLIIYKYSTVLRLCIFTSQCWGYVYLHHLQPWTSRFHCTKLHHSYDPNNYAAITLITKPWSTNTLHLHCSKFTTRVETHRPAFIIKRITIEFIESSFMWKGPQVAQTRAFNFKSYCYRPENLQNAKQLPK
jgi:hypothetical protein